MTEEQFELEAERLIYEANAKNINQMCGLNKTSALSIGVFLKLPINITTQQSDKPITKGPIQQPKQLMEHMSAFVEMGDVVNVNYTFFYHKEIDFNKILKSIDKNSVLMSFIYLHELQHILRKHNTSSYSKLMHNIAGNISSPHQAINMAEDYAINYSLKELIEASPLKPHWDEISKICLYNNRYHKEKMSDIDILKELVQNALPIPQKSFSGFEKVTNPDGSTSIQPTEDTINSGKEASEDGSSCDKTSTLSDDIDNSLSELADSISDLIQESTKGSGSQELLEDVFGSVKVPTGWFKRIKGAFKKQVYYATHNFESTWRGLNNSYRHIYKAPKKRYIEDKVSIIISIDQSGSMSTESLQKLLYLFEEEGKKIAKITALIHDTSIVKSFDITDDFDITSNRDFQEAFATRVACGGTSHDCVFKYIQDMNIREPQQVIYMSYSDNYSDIDRVWKNCPIMRSLTSFWIATDNSDPLINVPGTNIVIGETA